MAQLLSGWAHFNNCSIRQLRWGHGGLIKFGGRKLSIFSITGIADIR
jgi:hypothetical protein